MKDPLFKTLKDFLCSKVSSQETVIVGVSGGIDSSALLFLLSDYAHLYGMDLHIAHFDHGWREESGEQAQLLRSLVENTLRWPFHFERSKASGIKRANLEDEARRERLAFFQRVYQKTGASGLLLAHQREDQAETVLKRLFEGASLQHLEGIRSTSTIEGMQVWRPLLNVPREKLKQLVVARNWDYFDDETNEDPAFLRPRMRQQLLPLLESCFGKKVEMSLCRLSSQAQLLRHYFEPKMDAICERFSHRGCLGSYLEDRAFEGRDLFEVERLVRHFLSKQSVTLSYEAWKKTAALLIDKAVNKQMNVSKGILIVDRGGLIWLEKDLPEFVGAIERQKTSRSANRGPSFLSSYLQGSLSYFAEGLEEPRLVGYSSLSEREKKAVSSYLSKNKLPAKLKKTLPFVINKGCLVDLSFCFNYELNKDNSSDFLNFILKKP